MDPEILRLRKDVRILKLYSVVLTSAGQLPTYRAPDAPLAPGLVDAVAKFVTASTH